MKKTPKRKSPARRARRAEAPPHRDPPTITVILPEVEDRGAPAEAQAIIRSVQPIGQYRARVSIDVFMTWGHPGVLTIPATFIARE